MDETGAVVLPPVCLTAWDETDGQWTQDPKKALWPICVGQWYGYVNHRGQIQIMPRFDLAEPFIDELGLGPVQFGGKRDGGTYGPVGSKWGFINRAGKFVIQPEYTGYQSLGRGGHNGGLLPVAIGGEAMPDGLWRNQKWGFIDSQGNVVIPFRYDGVFPFKDDSAIVGIRVPQAGPSDVGDETASTGDDMGTIAAKWGVIDRQGREVIPMEFDELGYFSDGLACVRKGKKCGFVNPRGQTAIPLTFDDAYGFCGGTAPAKLGGKWGFIDRKGRWVVKPTYEDVGGFEDGLCAVKASGKWGLVDTAGHLVVPPRFEAFGSSASVFDFLEGRRAVFSNGLCAVRVGELWGYIDRSGALRIEATFASARRFVNGLALVNSKPGAPGEYGRTYYIDTRGREVGAYYRDHDDQ